MVKWEAVHLGEQGHQEGGESAKRAPVTAAAGAGKTKGEDEENGRVDDNQSP